VGERLLAQVQSDFIHDNPPGSASKRFRPGGGEACGALDLVGLPRRAGPSLAALLSGGVGAGPGMALRAAGYGNGFGGAGKTLQQGHLQSLPEVLQDELGVGLWGFGVSVHVNTSSWCISESRHG
jgi:hypothetical protein